MAVPWYSLLASFRPSFIEALPVDVDIQKEKGNGICGMNEFRRNVVKGTLLLMLCFSCCLLLVYEGID